MKTSIGLGHLISHNNATRWRHDRGSRRILDKIISEECKSKAKDPEIIIEYPEYWLSPIVYIIQ